MAPACACFIHFFAFTSPSASVPTAAVVVAFSVTFEWDVRQVVDVVPSASVASSVILT